MATITKQVADPNFEKWFALWDSNSTYMMLAFPKEFRETATEHDKIHAKARTAANACRIAVLDYSLLFHERELFHGLFKETARMNRKIAEQNARLGRKNEWLLSQKLKVQEQLKEHHEKTMSELAAQQRELRREHKHGEAATTRELLAEALAVVDWAAGSYGEHGRAIVYAVAIMTLNSVSRNTHPESGFFIDNLIKDMLLHEPRQPVREVAWENANMKDTRTLKKSDLVAFDRANEARHRELFRP